MESFIQDHSESSLEQCTKEQLFRIAEHCEVDIPDKLKECENQQPVGSPVTCVVPNPECLNNRKASRSSGLVKTAVLAAPVVTS